MNMKYKSITFICMNLECGGTERVITNLAYYYSKKNISTSIITLGSANLFNGFKVSRETEIIELQKNYSNYIFKRFGNYIYWISEINKYMKRNKNSIYISFLTIPNILTILASINIKILHYGSERVDPLYAEISLFWKLLRLIFYRNLKCLIVQTEKIKNNCKHFISERRIKIIPNSINVNIIKSKSSNTKNEKLKVLFIGRIEYQKGIDIFLDAIIKISKENKRNLYDFEIIGDGSLSDFVKETIRDNNLQGLLKYRSKSASPFEHIRKSNIVVHPSRYEGMSNVVLEAMALGKCVISTYQSSSEIITNKKDGLLLSELSSDEIIKNLDILYRNKRLLKVISTEAFNKIEKKYCSKKILNKWDELVMIPQK